MCELSRHTYDAHCLLPIQGGVTWSWIVCWDPSDLTVIPCAGSSSLDVDFHRCGFQSAQEWVCLLPRFLFDSLEFLQVFLVGYLCDSVPVDDLEDSILFFLGFQLVSQGIHFGF